VPHEQEANQVLLMPGFGSLDDEVHGQARFDFDHISLPYHQVHFDAVYPAGFRQTSRTPVLLFGVAQPRYLQYDYNCEIMGWEYWG